MVKPSELRNTQFSILVYLQKNQYATVAELSQAIKKTPADIRYHLQQLINQGRVEMVSSKDNPHIQRGRPKHLYKARHNYNEKMIVNLCSALLRFVLKKPHAETFPADDVAELIMASTKPEGTFTQIITDTVAYLNKENYQARWEATAGGPRLTFSHCPYAEIIDQFPELCQLDRAILRYMTNSQVKQIAQMNHQSGNPRYCSFVLSPEEKP